MKPLSVLFIHNLYSIRYTIECNVHFPFFSAIELQIFTISAHWFRCVGWQQSQNINVCYVCSLHRHSRNTAMAVTTVGEHSVYCLYESLVRSGIIVMIIWDALLLCVNVKANNCVLYCSRALVYTWFYVFSRFMFLKTFKMRTKL